MNEETCFLCGHQEDRGGPILVSKLVRVVSDIAPLRPGHLLISPVQHTLSMLSVSSNTLAEINSIKVMVRAMFKDEYKQPTVFFEHGALNEENVAPCGIDHAHLHAVPVPKHEKIFGDRLVEFLALQGWNAAVERVAGNFSVEQSKGTKQYLMTEDVDGSIEFLLSASPYPGQILRHYVASIFGSSIRYDWAVFRNEIQAQETTARLRESVFMTSRDQWVTRN